MQSLTTQTEVIDQRIIVQVSKPIEGEATGTLLVDSDRACFVYLLDTEENYLQLMFPQETFEDLQFALINGIQEVQLLNDQRTLELVDFLKELEQLLLNIEGNGNYGEFTSIVEQSFHSYYELKVEE